MTQTKENGLIFFFCTKNRLKSFSKSYFHFYSIVHRRKPGRSGESSKLVMLTRLIWKTQVLAFNLPELSGRSTKHPSVLCTWQDALDATAQGKLEWMIVGSKKCTVVVQVKFLYLPVTRTTRPSSNGADYVHNRAKPIYRSFSRDVIIF